MKKVKDFLKDEISGWKKWELIWLSISCVTIIGVSLNWGDSPMGIISAVSGVLYVLLAGKGKLSAYFFGLINSVLYAIISYKATLYGETMLNALYYVPMQFVGFYIWHKNMDEDTKEVKKERMTWKGRLGLTGCIAAATFGYGLVLEILGDSMPYIDAFTTMASVIAMIISVKRYAEQWWIWLMVNSVSVYMWWKAFSMGNDSIATLLMWVVYLISGILILVKWENETEKSK